jgi:hypothetical protein
VITGYTVLDQYDEARKYVAKANQLGLNGTDLLVYEMALYGATGDTAAYKGFWRRELDARISSC